MIIIILKSPLNNDIIFIKYHIISQCEICHIINKKKESENDFTELVMTTFLHRAVK